eukprot:gene5993-6231_t
MTPPVLTATARRLAQLRARMPPWMRDKLLDAIWQKLEPQLHLCPVQDLTLLLWSFSKLQYGNEEAFGSLLKGFRKGLGLATPRQVSNVMYAIASAPRHIRQHHAAVVADLLLPVFIKQLNKQLSLAAEASEASEANPRDVSLTACAAASLKVPCSPRAWKVMLTVLVQQLDQASPQTISNTLRALAKEESNPCFTPSLKFGVQVTGKPSSGNPQVTDKSLRVLVEAFVSKIAYSSLQETVNVLWALASLQGTVSSTPAATGAGVVAAEAAEGVDILQQEQQRLRVPEHVVQALLAHLLQELLLVPPDQPCSQVQAEDVLQLPVETVQRLLAFLADRLADMSCQEISSTLWAAARMVPCVYPAEILDQAHLRKILLEGSDLAASSSTAAGSGQQHHYTWRKSKHAPLANQQQLEYLKGLISKAVEAARAEGADSCSNGKTSTAAAADSAKVVEVHGLSSIACPPAQLPARNSGRRRRKQRA